MSNRPEKSQGNSRNQSPSRIKSLAKLVNTRLRCTLSTGTIVEGILQVFDTTSQLLILTSSMQPDSDIRIINTRFLVDFTNLDKSGQLTPKVKKENTSLPPSRRGSRPETPIKAVQAKPSDEAKLLCDALSRHFKARVIGQTIVINDTLRLEAPYTADSLVSNGEDGITRIKKLIDQERSVVMKRLASVTKRRDDKLPPKGG